MSAHQVSSSVGVAGLDGVQYRWVLCKDRLETALGPAHRVAMKLHADEDVVLQRRYRRIVIAIVAGLRD